DHVDHPDFGRARHALDEPVAVRALPRRRGHLRGRHRELSRRVRLPAPDGARPRPRCNAPPAAVAMSQFAKKLRGILEKAGKLDVATGEALFAESVAQKRPFTEILVKKGVATEPQLIAHIARAANLAPIDLGKLQISKEVLEAVPRDVARDYAIFPI